MSSVTEQGLGHPGSPGKCVVTSLTCSRLHLSLATGWGRLRPLLAGSLRGSGLASGIRISHVVPASPSADCRDGYLLLVHGRSQACGLGWGSPFIWTEPPVCAQWLPGQCVCGDVWFRPRVRPCHVVLGRHSGALGRYAEAGGLMPMLLALGLCSQ